MDRIQPRAQYVILRVLSLSCISIFQFSKKKKKKPPVRSVPASLRFSLVRNDGVNVGARVKFRFSEEGGLIKYPGIKSWRSPSIKSGRLSTGSQGNVESVKVETRGK